ncbi:MAG TPA: hypothetical protein VNC13_00645 [Propionibacteriaceae bacterium]|nr:hypothetical protein [Propionibacteriaceae bacterium]
MDIVDKQQVTPKLRSSAVPRAPLASAETAQQVGAGLLATAAGFGADAAMLMHAGVGFAFCGAACAGDTAGLQEGSGDVGVVAGVPGQHRAGRGADVSAVQVGPDALRQLGDHVLAEAGVGARRTGFAASEAGMDTVSQLLSINVAKILRVGIQHGRDV